MNSQDFAADYPWVDIKFARRLVIEDKALGLVRDRHLTIDDLHNAIGIGRIETTKDGDVKTADLMLWLGY